MSNLEQMKNALEKQTKSVDLIAQIESWAKELDKALPDHMKGERLARIVRTLIRQNPELTLCSPDSFAGAVFTAAQLGIEPLYGRGFLIPFNNARKKPDGTWHTVKECQFVIGYKGIVDLFYRHEKTVNLSWGIRHEKDAWVMTLGSNEQLVHIPAEGDRGPVIGYWVMARLLGGGKPFHYMTKEECLEHGRKHSKTFNKKTGLWYDNSPWAKDEEAMCLKTVLLQAAKIWPLSIELQRALDQDETAREIRPGITDSPIDVPSQVDWDAVETEVEQKTEKELTDNK